MASTPDQDPVSGAPTHSETAAPLPLRQPDQARAATRKSPAGGGALVARSADDGVAFVRRLSTPAKTFIALVAAVMVGGGGYLAWLHETAIDVPIGFARSNGRLEAERVDIATKYGGRLEEVRVAEGDWVTGGQVVAVMDTATLKAQLREAEAAMRQAEHQLEQASALVAQRESDLTYAQQELDRAVQLGQKGFAPQERIEQRHSVKVVAEAALRSANAQVSLARAAIDASTARAEAIKVQIADSTLLAPRSGRVQYRLALPGEVLPAGGKVITVLDLTDVYMTIFLPTRDAGRLLLGSEARLVFDAAPQYVVPAVVTYVAADAQFTPKFVETQSEREKLMFRIKLNIPANILEKYKDGVKTGMTGVAYVKVTRDAVWPATLQVKLPE